MHRREFSAKALEMLGFARSVGPQPPSKKSISLLIAAEQGNSSPDRFARDCVAHHFRAKLGTKVFGRLAVASTACSSAFFEPQIGRASCEGRRCQYVWIVGGDV